MFGNVWSWYDREYSFADLVSDSVAGEIELWGATKYHMHGATLRCESHYSSKVPES